MYSHDFCYWLQGYFEISGTKMISEEQAEIIQNHLNLVFKHEIDPSYPGDQDEKQNIHDGKPIWSPTHPNSDTNIRC